MDFDDLLGIDGHFLWGPEWHRDRYFRRQV